MKKTLKNILMTGALATAGLVGGGCTVTPEGRNLFGELAIYSTKEAISHEVNPRDTNVYIDNSGNDSQRTGYVESPIEYIKKTTFDLDANEKSKSIWLILYDNKQCVKKAKTEVGYVRGIKHIDLDSGRYNGCPEEFKQSFRDYIQAWDNYRFEEGTMGSVNKAWERVLDEAAEEGVVD